MTSWGERWLEWRRRNIGPIVQARREAAYRRTAKGAAEAAYADGQKYFQWTTVIESRRLRPYGMVSQVGGGLGMRNLNISDNVDPQSAEDITAIVQAGWHIIDSAVVFAPSATSSRRKFFGTGQQEVVAGQLIGVYTFERREL